MANLGSAKLLASVDLAIKRAHNYLIDILSTTFSTNKIESTNKLSYLDLQNGQINLTNNLGNFTITDNKIEWFDLNGEQLARIFVRNGYDLSITVGNGSTGLNHTIDIPGVGIYQAYRLLNSVTGVVHDWMGRSRFNTGQFEITDVPVYANNAAALAGGLTAGMFYRTGADPDHVCIVH